MIVWGIFQVELVKVSMLGEVVTESGALEERVSTTLVTGCEFKTTVKASVAPPSVLVVDPFGGCNSNYAI
jgi:hypothetical protein